VILDGTLLPIDRMAADWPFYSGKHKKLGMNVQVLTDPFGRLLRAFPAPPTTCPPPVATASSTPWARPAFADKGGQGADGTVRLPFAANASLPAGQRAMKVAHVRFHVPVHGQSQGLATTPQTQPPSCGRPGT
jgi:hypothetical protein